MEPTFKSPSRNTRCTMSCSTGCTSPSSAPSLIIDLISSSVTLLSVSLIFSRLKSVPCSLRATRQTAKQSWPAHSSDEPPVWPFSRPYSYRYASAPTPQNDGQISNDDNDNPLSQPRCISRRYSPRNQHIGQINRNFISRINTGQNAYQCNSDLDGRKKTIWVPCQF